MSKQEEPQDIHDDTSSITDSIESIPRPMSNKINKFVRTCHSVKRPFRKPMFRKPLTFHKFGELPVEIRLSIWEYAMLPRVHELHPCSKLYNERMTFRSNSSRAPSIFHTNTESRSVALKHYELFDYQPSGLPNGKGILRFYFNPDLDTLLLNSLMGLFIMFMLLDNDAEEDFHVMGGLGVMKGWKYVAFDARRAALISLLSGVAGHAPQPRFKFLFPDLKELILAFDCNSKGRTRFRTSVWPGEDGTTLLDTRVPPTIGNTDLEIAEEIVNMAETIFFPMKEYLNTDFKDEDGGVPEITLAKVKRKRFIRGDLRYAFRKTCSFVGLKPRGVFRRL